MEFTDYLILNSTTSGGDGRIVMSLQGISGKNTYQIYKAERSQYRVHSY
jgi:hypothetical protein